MKLLDALRLMAENPSSPPGGTFRVALVCGFTPLHLQTFLGAQLRLHYPDHHVEIVTGLFDDVVGTLRGLGGQSLDAVVLVLEWADIDPRLGIRRLGSWSPKNLSSIVEDARTRLSYLGSLVEQQPVSCPIIIALPTLPLPPMFFTAGWQAGLAELQLHQLVSGFAAAAAHHRRVRILSNQWLNALSPQSDRLNVKSAWLSGFPYRDSHAARLAETIATAIQNPLPKKGLITDLDDTLWGGIVGEDGPDGISWDLDHQTQAHGLYQQFLTAISAEGVLVAVASKNDPAVVAEAFARDDLLFSKEQVFPFAVGWGSKAEAVAHVLSVWNVHADSVVFVDDNPLELAEVQAAHPSIQCIQFPSEDAQAVYDLVVRLRDLFGRTAVSDEDVIRRESLRATSVTTAALARSDGYSETLLRQSEAQLTLGFSRDSGDTRALELVNKTNQFNLNGCRFTERAWLDYLRDPATFLLSASYKDRFGALGKIAVLAGRVDGSSVSVDVWVMSCRAFARRIEHQCLKAVFDRFSAGTVSFDYRATARNGPMTAFLAELVGDTSSGSRSLTAAAFQATCPALFHHVVIKDDLSDERYAIAAR